MKIKEKILIMLFIPVLILTSIEVYFYQSLSEELVNNADFLLFYLFTARAVTLGILVITIIIVLNINLKPLEKITSIIKEISLGGLEAEINIKGEDEVKDISQACERIKTSLRLMRKGERT